MGFLAAQYFYSHQPEGLPTAQICIMSRASWSCRDKTAFLDRPKEWLTLKCAVKPRSLERHLPQLAKLEPLVWKGSGFRLPRFDEFNRQIGGEVRQNGAVHIAVHIRKECMGMYVKKPLP
jgi:hypothetical protein